MNYAKLYESNKKNFSSMNPKGFLGNYIYGTIILIVAGVFAGVGIPLVYNTIANISTGNPTLDGFTAASALIIALLLEVGLILAGLNMIGFDVMAKVGGR